MLELSTSCCTIDPAGIDSSLKKVHPGVALRVETNHPTHHLSDQAMVSDVFGSLCVSDIFTFLLSPTFVMRICRAVVMSPGNHRSETTGVYCRDYARGHEGSTCKGEMCGAYCKTWAEVRV